ncbi:Eco57I restriction-modification methylase domain-containing protein [Rhizobium nepotum]|uniref:Eco57I restriction-modification methylase domain-containing protein n=1 Tax=Rhizobium nepotum TaxID=1035271 RepID=UPI003369CD9A
MGTVEGYEGDEAVIVDSGSGEMFQVPIANITEIAPPVGDYRFPEKADDGMPELSADPALEPLAPMGSEVTTELPPRSEDMAATDKRPLRPQPGHRVIVDSPEVGRFPARIERYENEGNEALVVDDKGNPFQVPTTALKVSSLTMAQVEAQDLERNPPIEREIGDAGPNSRKLGEATVILPDDNHAALYDFANQRLFEMRTHGRSRFGNDGERLQFGSRAAQRELADKFGISFDDVGAVADDYRFRVERAAKQAKSKLPFKMNALNDRLLKQRQAARAKEANEPLVQPADDGATWWDVDSTAQDRKRVLEQAGVKRSERMMWQGMTPGIKKKLLDVRDAQRAAVDDVATLAGQDVTTTEAAANEAATSPTNDLPEPTAAQKEAGNYKVGRLKLGGLDISIENPAGSQRKGVSSSGKAWSVDMKSHYGYIRGTVGRDKDHIDVFVRSGTETLDDSSPVFVVDQKDPARGRFDEHKVMAGFDNEAQARAAYLENYTSDWTGLGDISQTTLGDFKTWLKSGKTTEPFAPKWFASKEKADAYVDRNKMGQTHEVVQRGKRFDILKRDAETGEASSADKNKRSSDIFPPVADKADRKADIVAPKAKPIVSENKLFTDDAAAKARELLRKKLSGNTLNSGIDPELLQAGITLAGYHIEKGARTFAAYASAMLADLGEGARPYLKSWYMGVKYDPRATAFDGMSSAAEVEATDVNTLTGATNEPEQLDRAGAPALEGVPAEPVSGTENGRDTGRRVEDGSGTDVSGGRPARAERVPAGRGVADGQGELSPAAAGRQPAGRSGQPNFAGSDERGAQRPENRRDQVEEGPFGPILRGFEGKWRDAALELERRQTGDAIGALSHPDVGPIDLVWGRAGNNQHDGSGLAKLIAWHPEVLEDLQGFIDGLHVDPASRTERRIQLVSDNGRAGIRLDYDGDAKTWLLTAYDTAAPRRTERSSRRLSEIWAGRSTPASSGKSAGKSARSDTASTNLSDAIASRQTSTDENISSTLKDVQSAAVPAQQRPVDYVITDADGLGEGGQKAKFRTNVAAIELVKKLDEENRPATRDEQSVLAKWVGWGGLRAAFPREDGSVTKGWEKEAAQLKELLTKEEYSAAESSTRNAHFTSPEIVDAAWSIAQRLGFKGGQVLEPSVGAGNFLGLMPGDLRGASRVTGVELDRITGAIAKNLYPNANIQAPIGFEKLTVPDAYFDLAIGNPPFGSERLYDKERTHLNKLSIHNFFFAKAVETLRPGGVLAMVVTNRFLDGQSAAARNMIQKNADFIGAIRLPNNAFLKNAGTEVTTDIVILQRREAGAAPKSSEWLEVVDYRGKDGNTVPLNKYFANNPAMMLGDFGGYGSMYGPNEPALVARGGQDTPAELAKAIEQLPQNIMGDTGPTRVTETVTVPETVNDVQVGTMFAAPDGSIHLRTADHIGQPTSEVVAFPNETAKERVSGMIRVRDAFAKLRRAQISETASDQQIENLRKRLNNLYDAFVKSHGPVNSDANKRLFRDDPTWPQISALEQSFDKGLSAAMAKKTGEKARVPSAEKAAIFSRRTQQPYRRPTSATSAKDALATVLNDYGRINLDAMSQLYGKPVEAIVEELGPLVYRTPTGAYETADQYLSGNVKQKLAEAERAAEQDTEFRRNVNALRDVIPADIEAIDIDVKPGAPWLPANHVEDFISHIGQGAVKPRAFYSAANAKWDVTVPQVTPAAQTQWGTDRAGVGTVLSAVLNGQAITIHDRTTDGKSVVNQAATDAANEKAERVKAEWRKWLWQDDKRRDELARLYNDTFNTDVIQQFDGSHLTLPGKVGDDIIELRPSQKNFIWRTLQSGTALADHTVGAGKTFAAIASIMEKRRIGQARKPMLAVPNHLVGQWAADFVRLYPGAKVLAATKQDFEKDRRKRLFARIATGDWDAVMREGSCSTLVTLRVTGSTIAQAP